MNYGCFEDNPGACFLIVFKFEQETGLNKALLGIGAWEMCFNELIRLFVTVIIICICTVFKTVIKTLYFNNANAARPVWLCG